MNLKMVGKAKDLISNKNYIGCTMNIDKVDSRNSVFSDKNILNTYYCIHMNSVHINIVMDQESSLQL